MNDKNKEKYISFPFDWFVQEIEGQLYGMITASSEGKAYSVFSFLKKKSDFPF